MEKPPTNVMRWKDAVKATLFRINYHGAVNGNLVLALIWQESTGNPWAWNPEQRYPWLWDVKRDKPFREGRAAPRMTEAELASKAPPADFPALNGDPDNEWLGQQASWGLMQVMGAAARERRFRGLYLTELTEPYTNIEYGSRHLWEYCFSRGMLSTEQALKRWNVNAGYSENVLEKLIAVEGAV